MKIREPVLVFWGLVLGIGLYCYIGSRHNDPPPVSSSQIRSAAGEETVPWQKQLSTAIVKGTSEYCSWQTRLSKRDCEQHQADALKRIAALGMRYPNDKRVALDMMDCWEEYRLAGYEYAVDFSLVEQCLNK